jgi:hypothetical protein
MTRRSAATTQTPGASAAKPEKAAKPAPSNVEQQAQARRAKGPVDPLALKQPVFSEEAGGWVCPAKPDQITVEPEVEDEDDGEEAEA